MIGLWLVLLVTLVGYVYWELRKQHRMKQRAIDRLEETIVKDEIEKIEKIVEETIKKVQEENKG